MAAEATPADQAAQQLLAHTLDGVGAGLVVTDRQGRVSALNDAAQQVLGWTQDEARGCNYWQVFGSEDEAATPKDINPVDWMVAQGLQTRDQPCVTVVSRQGRRVVLRANTRLCHAADGAVSGMLTAFCAPAQLLPAEPGHERAQARFALVVALAPNAMLLVDSVGHITLANPKAEALFGYPPGALTGLPVSELVPPRARPPHAAQMEQVLAQGQARNMGVGRDLHGLRRDGTEVPLEIGLNPITVPDGRYTLVSIIDITSRKQQEDELRRSNADLEQFAYVASHDLQEPLRMVASYTELLAQRYKGQLDERADKYIFYAVDGARRMQQLVSDLLAYARVGSQGKPLQPVDCNEVLADVLHMLGPRLTAAQATVQADKLPWVMADEGQLHQLLLNLLGNALKFRSEAPPRIVVSAERDGEHQRWTFVVQDNGIGIEPQYAERIFQMFQRLHERGRYDGSGIGLAIARRILERHGGSIWMQSTPGLGSRFFFTLAGLPHTAG
ncbi:MAG: PAS domain S-box protein [Rubrivivax sp.]|nr:PAS domain S-box protein [Rubrivivax sp.]